MEPLLKWPGGKRKLVDQIVGLLPSKYNRYFEPFFGGGAVFFHLLPEKAFLSDKNSDLVNAYLQVKDSPYSVIKELSKWKNSEADYYRVRQLQPKNAYERAARLIYLCTLSFNGIYRQNLNGQFNVPYGFKSHVEPCDVEKITDISRALSSVKLSGVDFEQAVSKAKSGDLVYFDPPYTVAHGNNGFVKYNAKIFSWDDQKRLAELAHRLAEKGCAVYVSNADHSSIYELYKDFSVSIVTRQSVIAASREFRKQITECVFFAG